MIKIDEKTLKKACDGLRYSEYSCFEKKRIESYKSRFFGFTRKHETTNPYKDMIDFANGVASDDFYMFFINRFFEKNGEIPPPFSQENLDRAKLAVRAQHGVCIGSLNLDMNTHALPYTNYLMYGSLVRGYTEEIFIPSFYIDR